MPERRSIEGDGHEKQGRHTGRARRAVDPESHSRFACGSLGATEPDTDFPLFLEWMRDGKFPLEKLVTNRYSLEQIGEARVALEEGQILGRAIVEL